VARLNDALRQEHKLILLSTSPGFGKTTLLGEWVADIRLAVSGFELELIGQPTIQNPKVAWVSLDKDDNNPHRFLAYCVAALQTVESGVGQATLAMLQGFDSQLLTPEVLVTALINEATPITTPFIFVLDDYHVHAPSCISGYHQSN
jgi:LuxR family maltose regulon positive regulatory protein